MKVIKAFIFFSVTGIVAYAQNEQDALRYTRLGINGSSRFSAMGGAFGAVGADVSCAAYNPAGLAIFRKGEFSYSAGLRSETNSINLYNRTTTASKSNFNFNYFGLVGTWLPQDKESRNVFGVAITQPVNFNSITRTSGYTNSSSIAKDMLNLAREKNNLTILNSGYEGLGFDTYLIDTVDYGPGTKPTYFSNVDTRRSVLQKRDVTVSGKVNDINISLAHSYKDRFYFGGSLGLPQIRYESNTVHTEADDKDSMRVTFTSPNTYTTTYIDGLPIAVPEALGFSSMSYNEYFKTTGSGFNVKLGAIARVSDLLRLGVYFHSPTFFNLTDSYYNSMSVTFDGDMQHPIQKKYPANDGYYDYQIITPARLGLNAAFVIKKLAVIGVDYEAVNYRGMRMESDSPGDFDDVNQYIKQSYQQGHNLRIGAELNTKPLMFRAGYNMQGGPNGSMFTGDYVRNTISVGTGFRTAGNFYFDFTLMRMYVNTPVSLFSTLPVKALVKTTGTSVSATVGFKF